MNRTVAEIQADLDAAYASRLVTLEALSYRIDDGQGSNQVQRAALADIQKVIKDLRNELSETMDAAAVGTPLYLGMRR